MIIVPMDTKGVKKIRQMTMFGYNDKNELSTHFLTSPNYYLLA